MKKILLLAGLTVILSSCTVYRTISFKEDRSGSIDNRVDMTGLVAMMGETEGGAGAMGGMGDMAQLETSKKLLEGVPGISNVNVSYDTTGILYTSYDFTNVEALNMAMNSGGNSMSMLGGNAGDQGKSTITFKGKKFYMEEIDKKTLKNMQTEEKKKEMAQMEMMLASSEINTTIHFPRDVKKVSYKNASITNGKTVNFVLPIKDYISQDYKPLTIILK
jgi:hypothetical protein